MAHVRRKFVEAEPHYPAPCGEALALIGQLYAVEQTAPLAGGMDDAGRAEALRLRAMLRAEQSGPLVAELRAWAHRQRALPESSLGKAIAYMLGLWPGLTRFLEDPRIPLDNNARAASAPQPSGSPGARPPRARVAICWDSKSRGRSARWN